MDVTKLGKMGARYGRDSKRSKPKKNHEAGTGDDGRGKRGVGRKGGGDGEVEEDRRYEREK